MPKKTELRPATDPVVGFGCSGIFDAFQPCFPLRVDSGKAEKGNACGNGQNHQEDDGITQGFSMSFTFAVGCNDLLGSISWHIY